MSTANPNMNENINEYLKIHKELSELRKTQSKQKKRLIELESLIKSYMQDHNVDTLQGTNGGEIKLYDKKIPQTFKKENIINKLTEKLHNTNLKGTSVEDLTESILKNNVFVTEEKIKAIVKK
jgi:RNA binding exosome subunit